MSPESFTWTLVVLLEQKYSSIVFCHLPNIKFSDFTDAAEEVCISDTFNASCSAGEVVFIESAFYGRMRNKRCFNLTENESNCSTDVRQPLEARFGLRQNILLKLSSPFFTERVPTCLKGRMPLLEIAHQCAKCKSELLSLTL